MTGADDFLIKPIGRLELSARVASLLRLKLERDRLQLAAQAESDRFSAVSRNFGAYIEDVIGATQLLVSTELTAEQSLHASTILECSQKVLALAKDLADTDSDLSPALLDSVVERLRQESMKS
ncbi:hypothetical protein [Chamaesiphon minutus]|uniref:hypothetical protein n=1 Tax=Chamaesiphon minutus TaxID=1173032 RepID=UPI0005A27EED|nr:hypothetical protein [Chamaesiphon minutus]